MLKCLFTNYEGKAQIHAIFIIIFFFSKIIQTKNGINIKKSMKRVTKIKQ